MDDTQKFNDNGVVRNELVAYANYRAAGPLSLLDVHDKMDRHVLRILGFLSDNEPQKPAFRVIFYQRKGARSIFDLILTESRRDNNRDCFKWGGALTVTRIKESPFTFLNPEQGFVDTAQSFDLYYGLEDVSLGKVVDLRYPDTQEAFVRLFCPCLMKACPEVGAVGGFLEMLPTLVSQELGGTVETDAIGAYLRSVGAEALIYPSARCNVEVEIRDRQLAGYHGWNLVDYREAAIDSMPDLPSISLAENDHSIQIEAPHVSNGRYYGSWRIKGSSERAVKRFESEVKSYFSASPT